MKIVIDIDDNLYTRLFDNGVDNCDEAVDMATAIRKGTPLPEHHGRLIDADAFIERTERIYKQTGYVLGVYDIEEEPTIIERGEKRTCANCIFNGTNACSRGAGTVIDDRVCEDYLEGVRASD